MTPPAPGPPFGSPPPMQFTSPYVGAAAEFVWPTGVAVSRFAGMCSGPVALLLATEEALGDVEEALAVGAGCWEVAAEDGTPGDVGVEAC